MQCPKRLSNLRQQRDRFSGRHHRTPVAPKQGDRELRLEVTDLVAYGAMCEPKLSCSGRVASVSRSGIESQQHLHRRQSHQLM